MKGIKVVLIVLFVFSVTCISGSYAEDNFVTSENLSIEDVDTYIAGLAREEAGTAAGSYVTIHTIIQKDNRATVECEFCYVESVFTNVKHDPRKIIFERTESGRWKHVATGNYLTR